MNDYFVIPLFIAGSLLLTLFAFFLIMYLLVHKRKQNADQLERTQMRFDYEKTLLRVKIEEQENILDQISKELHDNIKSVLGFARMSMHRIEDLSTDAEQTKVIVATNTLIGTVIDHVHNLSHSMNSSFVKQVGLVEAINQELYHIRSTTEIVCNKEIKGTPVSLGSEKELHITRIAQEAIQNSIKHSKATNLNFVLNYEPGNFSMEISDNGIGFDKNKIHEMNGLGFLNMFQRARFVLGSLEVRSQPFQGTQIILQLNTKKDELIN
jgi:signal transduction histidine kinase